MKPQDLIARAADLGLTGRALDAFMVETLGHVGFRSRAEETAFARALDGYVRRPVWRTPRPRPPPPGRRARARSGT